ncbi:MAG: hypothetical protein FWE45_00175 [Firmicutes bacterium]|nr:hypothetical protein [Bacillota bacterium]
MAKIKDEKTDSEIHHGRRRKLRDLFVEHGLETFNETQVLEYALGLCIPRIDTNPTAHRLINKFGSLSGVIEAHPEKLQEVGGVGENTAVFLSFLRQFVTYATKRKNRKEQINNTQNAVEYLQPIMQTYSSEEFILVCLDKAGKIILQEQVEGNIHKVDLDLREIMDAVLRVKAAAVVVSHNHVSESVTPSDADILLTRSLVNLFTPLQIHVLDHLIFGKEEYYSFKSSGLLDIFRREHKSFQISRDWEEILMFGD